MRFLINIYKILQMYLMFYKGDLNNGNDVYYLAAKKRNGGVSRKVVYDDNFITTGNCIGFICDGDGSIGYHNYIELDEFIRTTNLAVGYGENIDVYTGLFLVTILDLERPKYSFGRKYKKRIDKTKIMLPVVKDKNEIPLKNKDGSFIPDWEYMRNYISLNLKMMR